jgi:hypothetical protein
MALAIAKGEKPRAAGELAYHVLDVMQSIEESYITGRHVEVRSSCSAPSPLPPDDTLVVPT